MRILPTLESAARTLGLSPVQVKAYARAGLISPGKDLDFQDVVLLEMAKELEAQGVPPLAVRRALRALRERLSGELTAIRLAALGRTVIASDGALAWSAETGQGHFPFAGGVSRKAVKTAVFSEKNDTSADELYDRACALEAVSPEAAEEAYRRALERDPLHADAHTNLGRLLHGQGRVSAAESHYRLALVARPEDPVAWFNLGVAQDDQGRTDEAVSSYERALALDPALADADYNLSRLHERRGEPALALRHLSAYRKKVL